MPDWQRLLVEPRRPAAVRDRPKAYWLAVAAVCVGAFMGQLDASIVTLAFPTLQRTFHAGVGAVTWVGLSYLLVLVATVSAMGRLADMAGRKLLYVYGFAVFAAGSALCAAAPTLGALDGFRALQAIGAAMLQANSVAIVALAAPPGSLGKAIGVQGAAQALGLALGPSVGGLLIAAGGWRLIFLVNVPVGVVGMAAALVFVPRSRDLQRRAPFDWPGLGLLMLTVVGALLALSFGNTAGWSSPQIVALLAVGAVAAAGLVARERRSASPLLDPALFRQVPFTAGIASGLLSYLVLFGVLFAVPFYLQRGLGTGSGEAGAQLMVLPVALGVAAPLAGRWADRVGARPLTVGGLTLVAAGLAAIAAVRPSTAGFLVLLAVVGAGLGIFTAPNNAAIMGAAPRAQAGVASGVLNTTRGLGTAVGLAVAGLVLASFAGDHLASGPVGRAFSATLVVLAALAALGAGLSGLRGRG